MIVSLLVSGMVATFTTLRSSNETLERYVSVWEEEVARNLLLKGDAQLFEKIRAQILDLASEVIASGTDADQLAMNGRCFAGLNLAVTLYGTPAGHLRICRSPERLILRSIQSPVFAFGLLAGLALMGWLLRRENKELAAKRMTELAVRVAHDIRSPIMALKIAAAQSDSGPQADTKALINAALNRISAVADDLLERSRGSDPVSANRDLSSGKTIHRSIEELVREKKLTASSRVIFATSMPVGQQDATAALSSNDFERVLSNLLENAIEATESKWKEKTNDEGHPRISVDTIESESNFPVTIRDNGIGIPKDVLPRIGEVGFSHGKAKGNGVGLSSARRWAQSRGGSLEIRSLEGTGTEVRLTLPRQQNPVDLQ